MLRVATDLPDTRVRFTPLLGDVIREPGHGAPGFGVETVACIGEQPRRVDNPAVAVELMLIGSAVTHPYGSAVGVPGPLVERSLRAGVLAVQA